MSNSLGNLFKITVFGESHSKGLGLVIEGLAPGTKIDLDKIRKDLDRRRPGKSKLTSPRQEDDSFEIYSGLLNGRTTGSALSFIIPNKDYKRSDYGDFVVRPRPSHADYPAHIKYQGFNDPSGSGQFSARLTAPLVIAGSIARDLLSKEGIQIISRIQSIYTVRDKDLDYASLDPCELQFSDPYFPCLDEEKMRQMKDLIRSFKEEGNSIGGIVETLAFGLPVGVGEPLYDSLESRLASYAFSIPGLRGIEFGSGFLASQMTGKDHNDQYYYDKNGRVKTKTNNHGGIIGGLSSSMPLVFRTSLKPAPTISLSQDTVDLLSGENALLEARGRHDPCIVPRSVVIFESITAMAILDLMMIGGFI